MPPKEKNAIRRTNTAPIDTGVLQTNAPHADLGPILPPQDQMRLNRPQTQIDQNGIRETNRFQNPIMLHPVKASPNEVQLKRPDLNRIERAYRETEVTFTDSASKRRNLLIESEKKYRLQQMLSRKEKQAGQALIRILDIGVKEAIGTSDAELVRHYNGYAGEGLSYIRVRYRLMRNRYYSVLPVEEMRKLERPELLRRLRTEYAKDTRNEKLIAFYQDLVRLKCFEDEQDEKKKDRENPANPPREITQQERRHNESAYRKNTDIITGLHISEEEKTARKDAMKRVMRPDARNRLWPDNDAVGISPEQTEGARTILAWMYRNCNKSSQSKEPFVYRLIQADPKQVLFMFYLVENGRVSAPNTEYAYKAMTSYIPDLTRFKNRVVASKFKFWKRIGSDASDDVINWSMIGTAARLALKNDIINDYIDYAAEAEKIRQKIDAPDHRENEEDLYYDLLLQKGNMLLTLYRSAGLSPDMPPNLIEEKGLRQRVRQLITEFREGANYLSILLRRKAEELGRPVPSEGSIRKKEGKDFDERERQRQKKHHIEDQEDDDPWATVDQLKTVTADTTSTVSGLLKAIGSPVRDITGNIDYSDTVSGIGAVTSVVGLIAGFVSAAKLARSASRLTAADHTARAFSVTSQVLKSTGSGVGGVSSIVGNHMDLTGGAAAASQNLPWYGSVTARSVSESFSTVSGGIQFCTGALLVAGGTLQMASGIIEMVRSESSKHDVLSARAAMRREHRAGTELTEKQRLEREQLRRLLNHQDRALGAQETSAGMKIIGGAMTAVGGVLMMTGLLSPVGGIISAAGSILNIGMGLIYARHMRNLTRKQAVDDALALDSVIEVLKQQNPALRNIKGKSLEKLKDEIRQKELGELGYATYKEAFSDLSKKNAVLLYHHVFEMPETEGTEEYNMFYDTLKSLGFKIKKAAPGQNNHLPTMQMIYAKLMG
ncbi:MAG: hypothetical protein K6G83_07045 [Lachnospiraceae bacterium]|nr:hypothetical protein [Lachnospiraceae bacterium]